MTRPASRIDSVLAALAAYWRAHPDLRLGQLVLNALRDPSGAVNKDHAWNAEDDVLVRGLAGISALPTNPERIVLADDDFDAFSASVMNPAPPNEALRALFRRTRVQCATHEATIARLRAELARIQPAFEAACKVTDLDRCAVECGVGIAAEDRDVYNAVADMYDAVDAAREAK